MSEVNSSPPIIPRFTKMPTAVELNVIGTENGFTIDFILIILPT